MVIAIFRSKLRPEYIEERRTLAGKMLEIAQSVPGFISYKNFTSDDSERVSIIEFASLNHLQAWRNHPEHIRAQQLGRERFYTEYQLQICHPLRAYSFKDGQRHEHTVEPTAKQ